MASHDKTLEAPAYFETDEIIEAMDDRFLKTLNRALQDSGQTEAGQFISPDDMERFIRYGIKPGTIH